MKRPHRAQSGKMPDKVAGAPPLPPQATRSRQRGWRDPKLALGLLLIGFSVVLGATLVDRADETVGVWALARDVPAGAPITATDLVSHQVKLPSQTLDRVYLSSDRAPAEDVVAAHALSRGELLARGDLAQESSQPVIEVPLQVEPGALPSSIEVGTSIDIWVIADRAASGPRADRAAARIIEGATLLHLGDRADALSGTTDREILIGVSEDRENSVAELLGALQDGRVVVTRRS